MKSGYVSSRRKTCFSSRPTINAGNISGVRGTATINRPYLSHWSDNASHAAITENNMTTAKKIETEPDIKNALLKLILNGVSISSLANVWSSGIVALNANTAPICTMTKTKPAKSRKRIRLNTSIGVESGEPTSNKTI